MIFIAWNSYTRNPAPVTQYFINIWDFHCFELRISRLAWLRVEILLVLIYLSFCLRIPWVVESWRILTLNRETARIVPTEMDRDQITLHRFPMHQVNSISTHYFYPIRIGGNDWTSPHSTNRATPIRLVIQIKLIIIAVDGVFVVVGVVEWNEARACDGCVLVLDFMCANSLCGKISCTVSTSAFRAHAWALRI